MATQRYPTRFHLPPGHPMYLAADAKKPKKDDESDDGDGGKVELPDKTFEDDPSGGGNGAPATPASPAHLDYLTTPGTGAPITYGSDPATLMNWQQPIFGFNQAQQQGLLGPGPGSPMSLADFRALRGLMFPRGY